MSSKELRENELDLDDPIERAVFGDRVRKAFLPTQQTREQFLENVKEAVQ